MTVRGRNDTVYQYGKKNLGKDLVLQQAFVLVDCLLSLFVFLAVTV